MGRPYNDCIEDFDDKIDDFNSDFYKIILANGA